MFIEIRKTTIDDAPLLASLHLASKKVAEKDIVDRNYLEGLTTEDYIQKWQGWFAADDSDTLAAVEGEKIIGLVSFGPLRTPPAGTSKIRPLYSSEIFAIYVHPDYFQKGAGKALLKAAVEDLINNKHTSLCLWALAKNKRACSFYEAMGGQRVGKMMVEMGPSKVKESCFGWRNIKDILEK